MIQPPGSASTETHPYLGPIRICAGGGAGGGSQQHDPLASALPWQLVLTLIYNTFPSVEWTVIEKPVRSLS